MTRVAAIVRRRRSGGADWTPAALGSSLALWLDASDPSTILSLDTVNVVAWSDKSPSSLGIGQETETDQPNYSETGLNGRPTIVFSGTEWFEPVSLALPSFSVMMVESTSQNSAASYYPIGFTAGATGISVGGTASSQKVDLFNGTTSLLTPQNSVLNAPAIVFAGSGGAGRQVSINGNTPTTDASSQSVSQVSIGRRGDASAPFFGAISEIVMTNNLLSTAARQRLEGYLAWKWSGLL